MSRYVMESGPWSVERFWVAVDSSDDKDKAYAAMVERAQSLRVYYEPHGGRQLRVREVTK